MGLDRLTSPTTGDGKNTLTRVGGGTLGYANGSLGLAPFVGHARVVPCPGFTLIISDCFYGVGFFISLEPTDLEVPNSLGTCCPPMMTLLRLSASADTLVGPVIRWKPIAT